MPKNVAGRVEHALKQIHSGKPVQVGVIVIAQAGHSQQRTKGIMHVLEGNDAQEALTWFDKCAEVAARSLCLRALCGSIIVKNGEIIAEGFNSPPLNKDEYRTCLNEYDIPAGFRHDRTCCIHAEQRAIENALKTGRDLTGSRIYFVAVDPEGNKIMATDLKYTICSRAVLNAGIEEFAFYTADGVRVYEPAEVDALSYRYGTPRL